METKEEVAIIKNKHHNKVPKSKSTGKLMNYYRKNVKKHRKAFDKPISCHKVIAEYSNYINRNDIMDLYQYNEIYYLFKNNDLETIEMENGYEFFKFHEGDHIAYRYEQRQYIGRGSFGTVIKCLDHKTRKEVAIKMIFNSEDDVEQIKHEIQFLTQLSEHENGSQNHHILNVLDVFTFRGFYCIVTDLNYTDVYTYMRERAFQPMSIKMLKKIGRQLADAIAFSHSAKIVHSDIKPENIMFTDATLSNISIIDFGCACYDKKPLYSVVQSLYYRAPEVIFEFKYGKEIDIWSFGCVLYELATGKPLFHSPTEKNLIKKITDLVGAPPLDMIVRSKKMKSTFESVMANRAKCEEKKKRLIREKMNNADEDLLDLICKCLQWLPAKRITAEEILEHPFFK